MEKEEREKVVAELKQLCDVSGIRTDYKPLKSCDGMADLQHRLFGIAERIRGTDAEPEVWAHEVCHIYLHDVAGDPRTIAIREEEATEAAAILLAALRMLNRADPRRRTRLAIALASVLIDLSDVV